jgi:hypothetical protein
MKNESKSLETTSRRQFTRVMVTAAVAAPIASMVGCKTEPASPTNTATGTPTGSPTGSSTVVCPCKPVEKDGYTEISLSGIIHPDEHIPPMGIRGGSSLVVDSRNKLDTTDTGMGPFNYVEESGISDIHRYGEIQQAIVVTERPDEPYLDVVFYLGFQKGTQLWLWYQNISDDPVDPDDTTFPAVTFPDADPDVKFIGGRGVNKFKMVVKRKKLEDSKSHKKNRPNGYKHTPPGGVRHFRIGQWRLVNGDTTLVGNSGADNYAFYVTYADFDPLP